MVCLAPAPVEWLQICLRSATTWHSPSVPTQSSLCMYCMTFVCGWTPSCTRSNISQRPPESVCRHSQLHTTRRGLSWFPGKTIYCTLQAMLTFWPRFSSAAGAGSVGEDGRVLTICSSIDSCWDINTDIKCLAGWCIRWQAADVTKPRMTMAHKHEWQIHETWLFGCVLRTAKLVASCLKDGLDMQLKRQPSWTSVRWPVKSYKRCAVPG